MSKNRSEILDMLFSNAERFMHEEIKKNGNFTNLKLLRLVAQDQQQAYIELLASYRDTKNRSPFNAAHQDIGGRIFTVAHSAGYARAENLDRMGEDIFGNPSKEKYYQNKED
jgi:hypothetical protein